MNMSAEHEKVVVSGMRSTGMLHLGHYHGAIRNWIELQNKYDCYFFAADWHALTTHYSDTSEIEKYAWHNLIDWVACGLNPNHSTMFIKSHVPEHAELHLLPLWVAVCSVDAEHVFGPYLVAVLEVLCGF